MEGRSVPAARGFVRETQHADPKPDIIRTEPSPFNFSQLTYCYYSITRLHCHYAEQKAMQLFRRDKQIHKYVRHIEISDGRDNQYESKHPQHFCLIDTMQYANKGIASAIIKAVFPQDSAFKFHPRSRSRTIIMAITTQGRNSHLNLRSVFLSICFIV